MRPIGALGYFKVITNETTGTLIGYAIFSNRTEFPIGTIVLFGGAGAILVICWRLNR